MTEPTIPTCQWEMHYSFNFEELAFYNRQSHLIDPLDVTCQVIVHVLLMVNKHLFDVSVNCPNNLIVIYFRNGLAIKIASKRRKKTLKHWKLRAI